MIAVRVIIIITTVVMIMMIFVIVIITGVPSLPQLIAPANKETAAAFPARRLLVFPFRNSLAR